MNDEKIYLHVCEVCGVTEKLTPSQAFEQGWDYPPNMGVWGVISPRTCGDCGTDGTVWWAVVVDKKTVDDLTEQQVATVERILGEPESIMV